MTRPLRLEQAGCLYHITSRGDRREDIYDDDNDNDREKWLEILGNTCSRFNCRCHAYCLMDNHYHIVIEAAEGNLSKGMRQLNGVYTQYYNRRHNRAGHVFQGRFKGILVDLAVSDCVDSRRGLQRSGLSAVLSQTSGLASFSRTKRRGATADHAETRRTCEQHRMSAHRRVVGRQ